MSLPSARPMESLTLVNALSISLRAKLDLWEKSSYLLVQDLVKVNADTAIRTCLVVCLSVFGHAITGLTGASRNLRPFDIVSTRNVV